MSYYLLTTRQNNLEPHEVYCGAKEIRELPESINRLGDIRLFSLCEPEVLYIGRKIINAYIWKSRYCGHVIYIDRQNLYISSGVSELNLNKLKIPECGHLLVDPDFPDSCSEPLPFSKYSYSELLTDLFS